MQKLGTSLSLPALAFKYKEKLALSQTQHMQLCSCSQTMCSAWKPGPFVWALLGVCPGMSPKMQAASYPP